MAQSPKLLQVSARAAALSATLLFLPVSTSAAPDPKFDPAAGAAMKINSAALAKRLGGLTSQLNSIESESNQQIANIKARGRVEKGDLSPKLAKQMEDYGEGMKMAFDKASEDVSTAEKTKGKSGNILAMNEFEDVAIAHDKRFANMKSKASALETEIKRGKIIMGADVVSSMSTAERNSYYASLDAGGKRRVLREYPVLFSSIASAQAGTKFLGRGSSASKTGTESFLSISSLRQALCKSGGVALNVVTGAQPAHAAVAIACMAACKAAAVCIGGTAGVCAPAAVTACTACVLAAGPIATNAYNTWRTKMRTSKYWWEKTAATAIFIAVVA